MKAYLPFGRPWLSCVLQGIWWTQPGEKLKQRKTENQEDIFAMAIIICSIDNNKTTVCPLAIPREFSCLLQHFLTHGKEIECKVTGSGQCSPLIHGGLKIPSYVMSWQHKRETLCEKI